MPLESEGHGGTDQTRVAEVGESHNHLGSLGSFGLVDQKGTVIVVGSQTFRRVLGGDISPW